MSEIDAISVKDAADRLKMTEQNIRTLIRNGKLGAKRIGKQWIITEEDLEAFVNQKEVVIPPEDHPRKTDEIPDIVALSFFSGAMGLDLGMEKAGIKALLACEFDKNCRKTIETNRPDVALIGDICNYDADDVRNMARIPRDVDIDVIFGGPPCQAFSTAGKRKGFDDARGNVFLKYLDLVADLRPKYVVIENVRGLLSAPYLKDPSDASSEYVKGGALKHIMTKLESCGYAVSFNLYNAANYGAPQIRERVVMIGSRDGCKPPYLRPTNSEDGAFNLPKWNTLGMALEGLDDSVKHYVKFPESRLKYYKYIKPGQYWVHLPEGIKQEAMGKSYSLPGGKTGFYRRLSFDRPSPTLVTTPTMPATDLCHPIEDRPLSVEEYRRIQGFPDDWVICGNIQSQYKQIGNAVPIALGEAIGKTITSLLKGETIESIPNYPYSRYRNTNELNWFSPSQSKKNLKPLSANQTTLPLE